MTAASESNSGRGTSPNFFIIGAARSGTTALAEILRHHPDAFVTEPKEPSFLAFAGQEMAFTGPGDDTSINRVAITDRDKYLSLYKSASAKACRGDASVSSLYYSDHSVATLQRYFPEAKLVVILRDPAARAFSASRTNGHGVWSRATTSGRRSTGKRIGSAVAGTTSGITSAWDGTPYN